MATLLRRGPTFNVKINLNQNPLSAPSPYGSCPVLKIHINHAIVPYRSLTILGDSNPVPAHRHSHDAAWQLPPDMRIRMVTNL